MQMRAHRALHLGRAWDQTRYLLWDLDQSKLVVTPHVRFVEHIFPGLSRTPLPDEPTADTLFSDTAAAEPPPPPPPPDALPPPSTPPPDPSPPPTPPAEQLDSPPASDGELSDDGRTGAPVVPSRGTT